MSVEKEAEEEVTPDSGDSCSRETESTEEEQWTVEKILDFRPDDDGEKKYLVHWKEYPESEATWEPIKHLEGATPEIEKFHKKKSYSRQNVAQLKKLCESELLSQTGKKADLIERLVENSESSLISVQIFNFNLEIKQDGSPRKHSSNKNAIVCFSLLCLIKKFFRRNQFTSAS